MQVGGTNPRGPLPDSQTLHLCGPCGTNGWEPGHTIRVRIRVRVKVSIEVMARARIRVRCFVALGVRVRVRFVFLGLGLGLGLEEVFEFDCKG